MANAFEVLGIAPDADAQQVRAAYRTRVKVCHPDRFTDAARQSAAQDELIRLNLAYEEALRLSAQRQVGFNTVSPEQAKSFARRLMEQGNYESALRQLGRAERKDAEWFYLQGQLLMALRQYDSAHQSFREAVRREPANTQFRRGALDAALAFKKHQKIPYKIADWMQDVLHAGKKS